ncbi:hypothetical protein NLX83_27415 [Allokutzneria sp. A3M-2-11 16]|uniref:hypothetical protein n=1 Tax=Allokutzneria sp. A3M-2-11 16 TaxID=2962043 RepID=UPI0020B88004|nr:hypothetical protein [Allokutzneria sp. A3M-2-11 16]MCP3803009.1 hypothetical protein [Allokutzneria sp. A3M-2-11 16]
MRVSLIVGAVVAAAVATTGTAIAESKASCSVVAQYNGTKIYDKADKPVGTLNKGGTRGSRCAAETHDRRSVVFLTGGKTYVEAAYVKITHGA